MTSNPGFAGGIPHNYDTYLGPLLFEPFAVDLVERLGNTAYDNLLELACGTGRVTRHLVHKIAGDGRLYATDVAEDMMRIAKERAADDRIEWRVADAHELPFDDEQFDLVVCQFGVMFFQEKDKAFGEVLRVLKKGGKFLFNTWDEVKLHAVTCVTNEVLKEAFPDDPPTFIEKGPFSFYDRKAITQLLQDAGFAEVQIEAVAKTPVAASVDDAVNGMLNGTPLFAFLQEHGNKMETVRQRLRERLVQQFGETNLRLSMQALVCTAVRP